MRPRRDTPDVPFAELLRQAVAAREAAERVRSDIAASRHRVTVDLDEERRRFLLDCGDLPAPATLSARRIHAAATATAPLRPRRRRLTDDERRALVGLRALGAVDLDDDCTPEEIKRAFRRLARRLHPDRVAPLQDPDLTRRRTVQFGQLRECVAVLTA